MLLFVCPILAQACIGPRTPGAELPRSLFVRRAQWLRQAHKARAWSGNGSELIHEAATGKLFSCLLVPGLTMRTCPVVMQVAA